MIHAVKLIRTWAKTRWSILPLAGLLAGLAYIAMLVMAEGVNPAWAYDLPCIALIGAVVGVITAFLFSGKHFVAVMLRRALIGAVLGLLILFPFVAWRAMTEGVPRPWNAVINGAPQGPRPISERFFIPLTCVLAIAGGVLGACTGISYPPRPSLSGSEIENRAMPKHKQK